MPTLTQVNGINSLSDKKIKPCTPLARPNGGFNFDTPATVSDVDTVNGSERGGFQSSRLRQQSKSPNRFRDAQQKRASSNNARINTTVSIQNLKRLPLLGDR